MVALTSAAPFPNASKVTPANLGGKPICVENISKEGEKYSSAVLPNNRNNRVTANSIAGERRKSHNKGVKEQKTKGSNRPSPSQVVAKEHCSDGEDTEEKILSHR